MARVFRFVDISGCELHTLDDPEDKLPLPRIGQVISIGNSRMRVVRVASVTLNQAASSARSVYIVRVRAVPASDN